MFKSASNYPAEHYWVVPVNAYATTVRRLLVDSAGQLIRSGRQVVLKFARSAWDRLNIPVLWKRLESLPIPAIE